MNRNISLIGVGSGWGATNMGTAHGPKQLFKNFQENSPFAPDFTYQAKLLEFHDWQDFNSYYPLTGNDQDIRTQNVHNVVSVLAREVLDDLSYHKLPVVIGGDHSIAIGTWSAVRQWLNEDFGLIWIDAHLDAHTFDTSPSFATHGMPVASLLGYGLEDFTNLLGFAPKIKPENLAYIGIRSFEEEETHLLRSLGVKIFDMDYIQQHGFHTTFDQAHHWVTRQTKNYGISFDIDAIDPIEAPGTGSLAANGLKIEDCLASIKGKFYDPHLLAFELVEFNPLVDQEQKTEKLIWDIMKHLSRR